MTKEEVLINHIQEYLDSGMWQYESCDLRKEDLKTIVEALKAESCEDCISRKATIYALGDVHPLDYNAQAIKTRIEQLPSVQPIRPKGKWVDIGSGAECSICHEIQYGYDNCRFFCPNCGADMRGEKE